MTDLRSSFAMVSVSCFVLERRNTEPSGGGVDGLELHKRGRAGERKERGRFDDDIYLGVRVTIEVGARL